MSSDNGQPTQKTRPKKGKPVEIPVPKRKQVEDFMRDVSADRKPDRTKDSK